PCAPVYLTARLSSSTSISSIFFIYSYACHVAPHSFPTRRSSDLELPPETRHPPEQSPGDVLVWRKGNEMRQAVGGTFPVHPSKLDRKSTRLNSSHVSISYAVFCLKKKR